MARRHVPLVVLLAVLVLIAGCSASVETVDYASGPEETALSTGGPDDGMAWEVTVTHVVDGDTVEARFPNGEVERLRLLGVDTPEATEDGVTPDEFEGIPDTEAGRAHLLEWGERASAFATEELEGETVRIAVDDEADRRGGYDRLLVYVYDDGSNFNERLLRQGYARLYDTPFSLLSAFEGAESTARDEGKGLWAFDDVAVTTQPRLDGRTGTLQIEGVRDAKDGGTLGALVHDAARDLGVGEHDRPEFLAAVRAMSHS